VGAVEGLAGDDLVAFRDLVVNDGMQIRQGGAEHRDDLRVQAAPGGQVMNAQAPRCAVNPVELSSFKPAAG